MRIAFSIGLDLSSSLRLLSKTSSSDDSTLTNRCPDSAAEITCGIGLTAGPEMNENVDLIIYILNFANLNFKLCYKTL